MGAIVKLPSWAEPLEKLFKVFMDHGGGSVRLNYQEGRETRLEVILNLTKEQAGDIARELGLH